MPNSIQYWKNPEKYRKKYTDWYKKPKNKERRKLGAKKYYKTDNGIKSRTISNWKQTIPPYKLQEGETWDFIYEEFNNAKFCNGCGICFDEVKSKRKCLDHNHDSGLIRGVLCSRCNKLDILSDI
jgi:Pyruvate/2-oxoacid:ferredoxin oxidoreductase delta subunit